ncbi:TerC family protein [Paenibacillus alvei]|uniref:TerC family protein n=1 Tax=Paenibacillus alvei TaxID=44250 RepID=A0AAP7A029_PAEAL|nr:MULTISPECIES: TerC family protein [Paenibacillus]MBG9735277.1 membrane protein [Paenibacillus alvei]MBG9743734.1 membrane protein [Paenibacillus alvei]MCY7484130.1 TerC family protein [Paenibacillus alvei]MCY9580166.1 TerC family protein [Paenibacillus alvei]MCY9584341.1 TerC family protein [Paenibacillus alvei]
MDFFTAEFWSALMAIVVIDLVLAGDNAIVIGLTARNLPKEQQKKVIFWGTFGAIALRSLLTLAVVWLLKIPGLLLIGGVLLVWIAYKLLVEEKGHDVGSAASLWAAIKTIIIADTVMGLDNVLAVAGAAHGDFILVVLGLLISVPIVVWGSTLIIKWVERFPVIIYIGAGVLAWTAAKMIVDEPLVKGFFTANPVLKWCLIVVIIVAVLALGRMKKQKQVKQAA